MTFHTPRPVLRVPLRVIAHEHLLDLPAAVGTTVRLQQFPQLVLPWRGREVDTEVPGCFKFVDRHPLHDLNGYLFLLFEQGVQPPEGRAGVQHLALDRVLADDDATHRIRFRVPCMNQDAEEMRHVVQVGHPSLESRAVLERDSVRPGGNRGLLANLFLAGAGAPTRGIRTGCREFPHGVLDGVTEKFAVHGKVADGVSRPLEFSSECYLHVSILFVSKE